MVDEDYFNNFNRRRPRKQAYRGSYRRPGSSEFFDPSADILAGIESVEKSIGSRKKVVGDFENEAALRRQETLDSLRDTDSMEDTTAIDSLQQQLINEVDELYKLDIDSFEGDRSSYLKKAGDINKIVETIPALMGLIDAEGEALKEGQSSSSDFYKKLLRSNDPNYYNFVDAASNGGPGVSFKMQNGNIIAQLDGKDIFNGNAYVKAKKDGFDLVKYAGDYTPQINEADALASKGLEKLISKEITEKINKGIELVGEEKINYTLARENYEERLRSGNIPLPVNESTYQMFTNYGISDSDKKDPWGKDLEMQEGATREAIIEYMIDQKFPGGDEVTTKTTTKEIQGPSNIQKRKQALAERKQKLEELKRVDKLEEDLIPKFKNKLGQDYKKDEVDNFFTARNKYKDIKINVQMMSEFVDDEGKFTQEGIDELDKSYPGISDVSLDKINTPVTLRDTLMREFLKKGNNEKGVDYNTFIVMNGDYEEFVKNQEQVEIKKDFDPNNFKPNTDTKKDIIETEVVEAEAPETNTEVVAEEIKEKVSPESDIIETKEVEVVENEVAPEEVEVIEKVTTQTSRDSKVENKKQEDMMRNSETTYGGKSGDDTIGLTDYEDYDFQYYLNSEKQVQEGVGKNGKMAKYWGGDQPKKGLKKDLGGKVYDGLSDGQQAMMRMQHVNIGWDPRVTMLLASGAIKPSERGEYLRDYKKTTTKYNDNKAKFKNIDDQKMFDQWVDLYANSEPNTKGLQKQYKRRVEDMAKGYGYTLTKEQLAKFKV